MPDETESASARLPLTPTTHNRMRNFRNGLGAVVPNASFDEAIALLLAIVLKAGEDELDAGRRLGQKLKDLKAANGMDE